MNFKNNQSTHPLYRTWQDMKRRCYNKNRPEYKNYGGRGIKVCKRWLENFWNFVNDMGEKPEGYSLERKNNDKGYYPSNCKWASRKDQNSNKREKYVNTKHKNIYALSSGHYQVVLTKPKRKYLGTFPFIIKAKKYLQGVAY